jgi:sulfate adenylyltransferase
VSRCRTCIGPNLRTVCIFNDTYMFKYCSCYKGVVRFKTYEVLRQETNNDRVLWNYLPYSMHMAGPREAVHHMMVRKNYGCTHFIIGRDMAGCKSSISGEDFYGPYDAQEFAQVRLLCAHVYKYIYIYIWCGCHLILFVMLVCCCIYV